MRVKYHDNPLLPLKSRRMSHVASTGEEFAVLMPNTTLEDAVLLAERIRLSIANTPFDTSTQVLILTGSLGAEIFTAELSGIDELLRNADMALYHAKNSGRNCVVAYPCAGYLLIRPDLSE
ncbi:MAG: GGDEF domain-containing protein [Chloroflexi bacterium]|nr:GGDEF domain-containing protein [Chloroflexota bacterium]